MEINIKKKKKPVWPWIVAILVILAIIFVLYTQFGDDVERQINDTTNDDTSYLETKDDAQMDPGKSSEDIAYYDEVKDFINYVDHNNEEETHQNYTEKATIFLAQALSRMVDMEHVGDLAIENKRDELMLVIESLNQDSISVNHHDMIGLAFNHASDLMKAMQKKDYPALQPQIYNIEKMAKTFQPDNLIVDQKTNVKEFFLLSKVALQAISEIDTF
ncbi:MAG: hypothetical protein M3421_14215 [Bacteroidota bacterium]|jgi:uncharacterized lipoprotein YehR (DUF1307 family)|nr:hypothetical protein [Bacteroidota bacterium]